MLHFCYKNVTEQKNTNTLLLDVSILGNWSFPFKKENTKKLPFKNVNKKIVTLDTMYRYFTDIYYYEDDKIQMISLPYRSKKLNFRMIILLPNSEIYSSSLNYLTLENINLNALVAKLKKK